MQARKGSVKCPPLSVVNCEGEDRQECVGMMTNWAETPSLMDYWIPDTSLCETIDAVVKWAFSGKQERFCFLQYTTATTHKCNADILWELAQPFVGRNLSVCYMVVLSDKRRREESEASRHRRIPRSRAARPSGQTAEAQINWRRSQREKDGVMPPKLCFSFQRSGRCRFGASCKFSHSQGGGNEEEPLNRGNYVNSYGKDGGGGRRNDGATDSVVTTPFSLDKLQTRLAEKLAPSTIFSGHSDTLVCFWPGRDRLEVLWKGFLMPKDPNNPWRVDSQTQALNFVNSGLHALAKDNLASQFVRELGKTEGRGVLVLQELLDLPYSNDAGRRRDVVSFQRGLVLFVAMLTMRRMEMVSQHMDEANYVYAYIRTAHAQLFRLYLEHLVQIVERHSIEDQVISHASFLREVDGRKFAPLCFTQVCLPFVRLLYLLGNKFKDFIYEDTYRDTVNYVDELTMEWIDNPQAMDSHLDSNLCFKIIREEVNRLHKMIRRGKRTVEAGATLKRKEQQRFTQEFSSPQPWDVIEVGIPGEAVLQDGSVGPRHDNDHRDIRDIQLLPTTEECLSREPPLLPGNFPFHKNAHWLPPGPERWVDTHFRLYREDLIGTIRSCLQDLEHRIGESQGNLATGRLRDADVDYNVYPIIDSTVLLKHTDSRGERDRNRRFERHGLCIDVHFPQPSAAEMTGRSKAQKKKDNAKSRKEIWEKTGRLQFNGMVALVTYAESNFQVVFCQIVERDLEQLVKDVVEVTLQPFEIRDFATLERWQHAASVMQPQQRGYPHILLLEFNKVFYVGNEPVLRALQSLQPATMPFLEYLAPETQPARERHQMECPMYCLRHDFTFDLSSVIQTHPQTLNDIPEQLRLHPLHQHSREACEAALVHHSTLEREQAKALVEALSSRVACIQGLPGSGKSFIGSMLTRVIVEAKVSPVLIVCYTNHALDQFLCHLLDVGITSLVRVGGQCKEPRLDRYNLNKLPKSFQRYELKLLYEKLDADADSIAFVLRELDANTRQPTWRSVKWFLETNHPDAYDNFVERSAELYEDDWEIAGCKDILDYWIKGKDFDGFERHTAQRQGRNDRMHGANVWIWGLAKRRAALTEWIGDMRATRVEELVQAQKEYYKTMKKIQAVKDQADVKVLEGVQIIGMTTTGVAKNQQKIVAVAPPVVVCEEAGEVLEAQLMACLSPACQQLVLIGDHKQLRPHIADYNLSAESAIGERFALDVSLFERLVGPASGLPFWMLTEQHRMRPQISQLVRMLFYPELRDARETLKYPHLRGVDKNVYFVNHHCPEDGATTVLGAPARSHSNEYEVAYVVATLRYLLQQGYPTKEIAILTPYVGQLMKLRTALRGQFVLELNELDLEEIQRTFSDDDSDDNDTAVMEGIQHNSLAALGATKKELSGAIRAATIDNFQGEEATVVIVSLVRSSANVHGRGAIGFLKTPNRINVLLSRAMHGLILVGHGKLLRTKSPLWQNVLNQLDSDGCYGDGLPLHCQRHPDDKRVAADPTSFALLAPDGGCLRPCGMRLPRCGHACPKLCHVDQPSHTAVYCTQPCPRLQQGCGHVCPGVCGDACGPCEVCPPQKFCHVCGDDNVKERVADVLLFQTYGDIDPDEDPVLVLPCCSMVYTMTTLDGTLHMNTYYDGNGKPLGPLPEEYIDTPQCPNCKKPIRGLRRYGRIIKRAAIDAAEKKFISHSQRQLVTLQERTNAVADSGEVTQDKTLRHDLRTFGASVRVPPCQKAFEACVALLTKAKGGQGGGDVDIDFSTLPVPNSKFPFLGHFYLLSAQLSSLGMKSSMARAEQYARQAVAHFTEGSFSQQSREARLMLVQIMVRRVEEKLGEPVKTEKERKKREEDVEELASEGIHLLDSLETSSPPLLVKHGQQIRVFKQSLINFIQQARSYTFYQSVSIEEMKAIKSAMQTEFYGSGHWYRCVNGHSYSIGECGMAMERTRCPECGAPVGGANHTFVEGTVRDSRMDSL
ncbi:unnamed protein product [Phytophthora lilii]|uniref:Unnamed protein product n=1 Tax=Phytophthora lilii TaxID=2077276 RepID=A0A9W6WX55_9STRA|nr:unnamed protein product [Phytophthora lilii]